MQGFLKTLSGTTLLILIFCHCGESQEKSKPEKLTSQEEVQLKAILRYREPLPYSSIVKAKLEESKNKNSLIKEGLLHELLKDRSAIVSKINSLGRADTLPPIKLFQYKTFQRELIIMDATIAEAVADECFKTNDCQDVELYDGTLGVTKDFVTKFSPQVGKLKWKNNLPQLLAPRGILPGNVNDTSWGTGALISDKYFITAGHCFDAKDKALTLPSKNGVILPSTELAKLMEVTFNYQKNQSGGMEVAKTFEIDSLMEYKLGDVDYAIVRLKPNYENKQPGSIYGYFTVSLALVNTNETLCVIQHPEGEPKKIEAGPLTIIQDEFLGYNDIDTYSRSSGSPVLSYSKKALIGVHVKGGCDNKYFKYNSAIPVTRLFQVSPIIRSIAQ